jgi:hypothetical protein
LVLESGLNNVPLSISNEKPPLVGGVDCPLENPIVMLYDEILESYSVGKLCVTATEVLLPP